MKKLLFSILPRKKDFHAKLQVHFGFCCHDNQLLHCNVCTLHCSIIKCIVRNDDVSFTRNKRVNERIILSRQFPCKISGPLFTCFDISMVCIITQYSSTVYIGICHGWSSIIAIHKDIYSFHFQFQFNLTSNDIKVDQKVTACKKLYEIITQGTKYR